MPKFIIERDMPGAGKMTGHDLQHASEHSNNALKQVGRGIQWLESYVTDDKVFCVYIAPDEKAIREHAKVSGFPATAVREVRSMVDPTTAETHAPH
jgi:hypothetical protein